MKAIFRLTFLLCFFLSSNVSFGQVQEIPVDTANVQIIVFNEELIDEILSIRDFNYENDPQYEQNILRRYWNLLIQRILNFLGQDAINKGWSILKYGLIFLGVGLLIYYLLRLRRTYIFRKEDRVIMPDESTLIQSNQGAEGILQLLNEAEKKLDFKNAVRYRFLAILRLLNASGLIKWRDFKTNREYVKEISEPIISRELDQISHVFEDIYYGDYEINEEKYQQYKLMFENFSEMLKIREG